MLDPLTLSVIAYLAIVLGVQMALKVRVIRHFLRPLPTRLDDADCPPVMVVLCLRGGDPFLQHSLGLLMQQDYPDYRVRIVVDSAADEAHSYLRQVFGDAPPANVEIITLPERQTTCTFKMSGILYGTQTLPEGTALVALMDGDTVPHASWLRELAAPIVRDGAGVSMGNRWYASDKPTLGSMCRFWWNASALPVMTLFQIPWGGTMAVRADLIQNPELRDRLRHAYSEDTTIGQCALDFHQPLSFPPTLIIVNREEISVPSFFQFDVRQLIAVRITHRRWPLVVLQGLLSTLALTYPAWRLCGLPVHWPADIAFVVFFLAVWISEIVQGYSIRKVLATRGERITGWNDWRRWYYAWMAVLMIPFLHLAAVVHAATLRRVRWRGVLYRIGGRPPVQVERDEWAPR